MIDAFKLDYLKYAPYLSSLTKKYQWGELEMPSGHWGGVEIFFKGESDKLALFHKGKGRLRWVRYFSWLDNFGNLGRFVIDCMINFGRWLRGEEISRTGKIPLRRLWRFDFSVKKPLYSGLPIKFTHILDLDEAGHRYGTKSKEMIEKIKQIDMRVSKMDFDIIFSDHGMADVTKIISVPVTKNCFIDSDMARYWGSDDELEEVKKKLPMKHGKIIDWPDKSYGELIFMVNTGVLILPNFWQGREKVKAMHGYDGKHKEMKAIYILNKKGKKKNFKVRELHKIFKEMLRNGRQ